MFVIFVQATKFLHPVTDVNDQAVYVYVDVDMVAWNGVEIDGLTDNSRRKSYNTSADGKNFVAGVCC